MSKLIRLFEPGVVYSAVQTVVDRAFLFAPNHDPSHPLLARGCPPEALDPESPIVPVPSLINIVGSAAARALELAPINLHALALSVNHEHADVSTDDDVAALPEFFRDFHSTVARDVNAMLGREGHLYAGPTRLTPCANDDIALQQVIYTLSNPVKDGLVDRARRTPFFSTYKQQAFGDQMRYWDISWESFHEAGGVRCPRLNPKQFMKWRTLELSPLPHLRDLPEHQRQTLIRKLIAEVEEETAEKLKREGRAFAQVSRHFELDPRDRPKTPRTSGSKPLVHASTKEERDAYREKYLEVRKAFVPASIAFRQGLFDVEFPPGTFRPPIIGSIPIPNTS